MREGVGADDGLVGLDDEAGQLRDELAAAEDLGGLDVGGHLAEEIGACVDGHDDFFHGGVSGAFSEAVDGAFDLASTVSYAGQGIGDSHTEVVVAMGADDGLFDALDVGLEVGDDLAVLVGQDVADGIGDVQRGGAGLDYGGKDLVEEGKLAAAGILRRELNVIGECTGIGYRLDGHPEDFVGAHSKLVLHVNGRGCDERVDALARCGLEGLAGGLDIFCVCACQAADDGAGDGFGAEAGGLELSRRGYWKAGLDVDAHLGQLLGDFEFSLTESDAPGDCSPSRNVVSNMSTFSEDICCLKLKCANSADYAAKC